jgi:hypothetical protein
MNDINGYTITETTNEDSRVYTHTFSFPASSEQTTVKVEPKWGVPKLKGILKKHNTIAPTVSPFDPWCDGIPVDDIIREDVLDTVLKPICATYRELEAEKLRLNNTPGGVFKTKGLLYAFHTSSQGSSGRRTCNTSVESATNRKTRSLYSICKCN